MFEDEIAFSCFQNWHIVFCSYCFSGVAKELFLLHMQVFFPLLIALEDFACCFWWNARKFLFGSLFKNHPFN